VTTNPNILEKVEVGTLTKAQSDAIVQQVIAELQSAPKSKGNSVPQNQNA
jgi:hypothetical protein